MRSAACTLVLCLPLLVVLFIWTHPLLPVLLANHDRAWWIAATPLCLVGHSVCVNVWQDRTDIILSFPTPR